MSQAPETPTVPSTSSAPADAAASSRERLLRDWSTPLILVALITAITLLVNASSSELVAGFGMTLLINVVLVVGLYVFAGTSGVISFGHVSFMAIGAYLCALLTMPIAMKSFLLPELPGLMADANLPPAAALVVVGVVTMAIAAIVGIPLMRVSGIGGSIITFALLLIVFVVINEWDSVTGGAQSLNGVPTGSGTPMQTLPWAIGVIVVAFLFQRSAVGLRLKASREDETAARSVGIGVVRERVVAFGLSAGIVAIGGGLYAFNVGSLSPTSFYLTTTFVMVMMLVVGGLHSLSGAVIGAVLLSVLNEVLRAMETGDSLGIVTIQLREGAANIVLALLLIVTLMLRPEGIVRGRELRLPNPRRKATS